MIITQRRWPSYRRGGRKVCCNNGLTNAKEQKPRDVREKGSADYLSTGPSVAGVRQMDVKPCFSCLGPHGALTRQTCTERPKFSTGAHEQGPGFLLCSTCEDARGAPWEAISTPATQATQAPELSQGPVPATEPGRGWARSKSALADGFRWIWAVMFSNTCFDIYLPPRFGSSLDRPGAVSCSADVVRSHIYARSCLYTAVRETARELSGCKGLESDPWTRYVTSRAKSIIGALANRYVTYLGTSEDGAQDQKLGLGSCLPRRCLWFVREAPSSVS